jgi:hypothetical protein
MFTAIILSCIFPAFIFAKGKCELTIQNKTDATIVAVIIHESETNEVQSHDITFEKNTSETFKVNKNSLYDIVLVDRLDNRYGKTKLKWNDKHANVSIGHKDFIHDNLWDIIKALFTMPFRG